MGYDDENPLGYESVHFILVQDFKFKKTEKIAKKLSCGYVSRLM